MSTIEEYGEIEVFPWEGEPEPEPEDEPPYKKSQTRYNIGLEDPKRKNVYIDTYDCNNKPEAIRKAEEQDVRAIIWDRKVLMTIWRTPEPEDQ